MTYQHWFIQNNEGEDCSTQFNDYDRALMWKQYLSDANPDRGPYLLYGFVVDESGKLVCDFEKENKE
jgi:hypothetical protein